MKSRIRQMLVPPLRFTQPSTLALAVFVGLVACTGTTEPTRLVSITPAAQTVALQTTASGKFLSTFVTLTNMSKHPVTFDFCALTLEKRIDGPIAVDADGPTPPWYTVWSPICAVSAMNNSNLPTASLAPGESITIPVRASVGQNDLSAFDGSAGTYRVHLTLEADIVGQFRTIPHDLSVSDPFTIVAQ